MKKIPFYLVIFFLTTGFLRSDLEKCADYNFRNSSVLPMAEYTTSAVPEAVYKKRYDEYLKKKNIYDQKRKKRKADGQFCQNANLMKLLDLVKKELAEVTTRPLGNFSSWKIF